MVFPYCDQLLPGRDRVAAVSEPWPRSFDVLLYESRFLEFLSAHRSKAREGAREVGWRQGQGRFAVGRRAKVAPSLADEFPAFADVSGERRSGYRRPAVV